MRKDQGRRAPAVLELAFTTREICEHVGVAPSTLNSWTKGDDPLVSPSLIGSDGVQRSDRYWSPQDMVTVRTVKALRQAGCPLQQIRKAKREIEAAWNGSLGSVFLYWDGDDVVATDPWGSLRSLVRHPGQQMLHLVAMPLEAWRREAEHLAKDRDLQAVRERRAGRVAKDRQPEPAAPMRQSKSTA